MSKKNFQRRIRIRLKGFNKSLLDKSAKDITDTAKRTGAMVVGPIPLPTKKERYTVLKSPHVDKKSREQFEIITYNRLIEILDPPAKTLDALKALNLSCGVDIRLKI